MYLRSSSNFCLNFKFFLLTAQKLFPIDQSCSGKICLKNEKLTVKI